MTPGKRGLPTWTWLLIGFGAFAVLGLVTVIALGAWAYSRRGDIADFGKERMAEGRAYGRAHTQDECVDQSFRELEKCGGLKCELGASLFVGECAKVARPSSFCASVPDPHDVLGTTSWSLAECRRRGYPLTNLQRCSRHAQALGRACHPRAGLSTPSEPSEPSKPSEPSNKEQKAPLP